MKFLRRYPELLIITILAFLTRLWDLFVPHAVVFDEVFFKFFAGQYLNGHYYFDIHPPLGKLLLGGWAWLSQQTPDWIETGDPVVVLRVLPAIAGALIIPVFYLFLRQLGASRRVSTLGAVLLLLDNALLVESRFILLDSMLILFGLSAITCFLAARRRIGRARLLLLIAAAILAGMCVSTKWTGLSALGLIGVAWLFDAVRHWKRFSWMRRIGEGSVLVLLPVLVYVATFAVHFQLLPSSGQGDPFMSDKFKSTLVGSSTYDSSVKMSFAEKFMDLHQAIIRANTSLEDDNVKHPYSSKWTSWPLMMRPVFYWQSDQAPDGIRSYIYLLGNPVVWWGTLIVILAGGLIAITRMKRLRPYRFALVFLVFGYLVNILPFAGIVRIMFLYHYFFAFIFSLAFAVILLGILCDWMREKDKFWHFPNKISRNIYLGTLVFVTIGFLFFIPLSYGWPLSPSELLIHIWLPSWR